MTKSGVLLLSHCGFSFMEDLIAALSARGLRSFILTSSPLPSHQANRLDELSSKADWLVSTDSHVLTPKDVEFALVSLQERGETVLTCITVWEGYRMMMALANARLGVADLSSARVNSLRNKLAVRHQLGVAHLTRAQATALTRHNFESLRSGGRPYFVKPICGIASYGAFAMRPDTEWCAIERVAREAQSDELYKSAFGTDLRFMAEDYVPGREFSFELLVVGGRLYVLAIHEKCEITEMQDTVLENACVSPPVSLDAAACSAGIHWMKQVFRELELDWGCFHVEARYDGERWDLIEINPRVGGCLISPSVKALNGEAGVLELWLDMLLASSARDRRILDAFESRLAALSIRSDGTSPFEHATFFRAYFAQPGKIESVDLRDVEPAPAVSQVFLKRGEEITQASREVFVAQLLWRMGRDELESTLPELLRRSAQAVEVRYATSNAEPLTCQTEVLGTDHE
jgi:hypothetical protein